MISKNEMMKNRFTPELALESLIDGNNRFQKNKPFKKDYKSQIAETSEDQSPFAIILSCIDSRIPIEIIFDLGIGDVFNIRIAGNIVNNDILGSMEFACKLNSAKLILVLGHTNCGAVKGACDNAELGHLTELLQKIKPAINSFSITECSSEDRDIVDKVARKNVELAIAEITTKSSILNEMYKKKEIDIIGAMYDVRTGEVELI